MGRKRNFELIESYFNFEEDSKEMDSSLLGDLELVGVFTGSQHPTRTEERDWCEQFSPTSSAELVGNKNKISELSLYLKYALAQQAPSVLHLTGPPGCGKSTALRVLGKELEMDVIEWNAPTTVMTTVDPSSSDTPIQYPEGQLKCFKRFLIQHNYCPVAETSPSSSAVSFSAQLKCKFDR